MRKARFLLPVCLICIGFGATSRAQQGGPGLAETMNFIQEKVNNGGAALDRFDFGNRTGVSPVDDKQILEVMVDPAACTIKVRVSHPDPAGEILSMVASLRDAQKVSVTPRGDDAILQISAAKPVFKLRSEIDFDTRGRRLKDPIVHDDNAAAFSFRFNQPDMADRVGKAAQHAVELCGGGPKVKAEPF